MIRITKTNAYDDDTQKKKLYSTFGLIAFFFMCTFKKFFFVVLFYQFKLVNQPVQ